MVHGPFQGEFGNGLPGAMDLHIGRSFALPEQCRSVPVRGALEVNGLSSWTDE
jgi:hypothetical protein